MPCGAGKSASSRKAGSFAEDGSSFVCGEAERRALSRLMGCRQERGAALLLESLGAEPRLGGPDSISQLPSDRGHAGQQVSVRLGTSDHLITVERRVAVIGTATCGDRHVLRPAAVGLRRPSDGASWLAPPGQSSVRPAPKPAPALPMSGAQAAVLLSSPTLYPLV